MKALIAILLLTSYSNTFAAIDPLDFDIICDIFTESQDTNLSQAQLNRYIHNNIENRVTSKESSEFFESLFDVSPADRYKLLKKAAEMTRGTSWDCPAAEKMFK